MTEFALIQWLSYATIVAESCLLLQLLRLRLAREYGWLFGYYLVDIVESVVLIGIPRSSITFGWVYFPSQGLKTLLAAGFSLQIWDQALRSYPALARFGKRFGLYLQLGAGGVAALGVLLNPHRYGWQTAVAYYFNAFQGWVDASVVLFLLACALFLVWFPVKVSRNTSVCAGLFFLILFKDWAILLLLNLYPRGSGSASVSKLFLDLGCQIFWASALRAEGQSAVVVTGHRWNPSQVGRLLRQLDAINARLNRLGQR